MLRYVQGSPVKLLFQPPKLEEVAPLLLVFGHQLAGVPAGVVVVQLVVAYWRVAVDGQLPAQHFPKRLSAPAVVASALGAP